MDFFSLILIIKLWLVPNAKYFVLNVIINLNSIIVKDKKYKLQNKL